MGGPDPVNPVAAYAEGKRVSEYLCTIYSKQHDIQCKIGCFSFCRPTSPLDAHLAIGNFIRDVLRGRPIEIKGDGTPCRSYLYAADLAIWLWQDLIPRAERSPINVGSPQLHSLREIAEHMALAATLQPRSAFSEKQRGAIYEIQLCPRYFAAEVRTRPRGSNRPRRGDNTHNQILRNRNARETRPALTENSQANKKPTPPRPRPFMSYCPFITKLIRFWRNASRSFTVSLLLRQIPIRFVICEDGSRDNTVEVIKGLSQSLPIHLISDSERKGYSRAVLDGFRATTAEFVGFIDSDGQCDPRDFAAFCTGTRVRCL